MLYLYGSCHSEHVAWLKSALPVSHDVCVDRPETGKRLVREEDEEGSDEERITMAVNTAARDRERRREAFLAAQDAGNDFVVWRN